MNIEANRLATFVSWPSHFPIEVARIARGGFYATGREREAECHWCRQRISDWRYGDQVMNRHRQLDPLCPFITDPIASGNVPTLDIATSGGGPSTSNHIGQSQRRQADEPLRATVLNVEEPDNRGIGAADDIGPDYMNEQCRLDTFTNWPITCVTPVSLARAGFYYYNQSDHVRCAWCQGVIAKWEQGDDPFVEHSKFFPSCPRAMCGPNVRLLACDDRSIEAIGIQPHQPSRHEAFASLDVRLQSFQTWPIGHVQRPEVLAAAGFYYLDVDDFVRCFHCSGGLRSWLADDDPWHEHAKYFPRCGFVEMARGRGFVQKVNAQQRPTLDEAMAGEWPSRALEMGFAVADVRQVVAQRLEVTSAPFDGIDDLVVAILSLKVAAAEMGVEVQTADRVTGAVTATTAELQSTAAAGDSNNVSMEDGAVGGVDDEAAALRDPDGTPPPITLSPSLSLPGEGLKSILSGGVAGRSLEDENRKLKDAILCKVCMVEEVGIVFLPCGHLVSCVQCASSVAACPLCRTTIKAYVRTYLS